MSERWTALFSQEVQKERDKLVFLDSYSTVSERQAVALLLVGQRTTVRQRDGLR